MSAPTDFDIKSFHLRAMLMILGAVSSGGIPIFPSTDGKAHALDALAGEPQLTCDRRNTPSAIECERNSSNGPGARNCGT
jgi:hypothetical protein